MLHLVVLEEQEVIELLALQEAQEVLALLVLQEAQEVLDRLDKMVVLGFMFKIQHHLFG